MSVAERERKTSFVIFTPVKSFERASLRKTSFVQEVEEIKINTKIKDCALKNAPMILHSFLNFVSIVRDNGTG